MKKRPVLIYQDEAIAIVNKPADYLSIPDRYDPEKPNIQSFLKNVNEEVFTVHRLDKETSGIICFALNEKAHKSLSQQFESRTVDKNYLALVQGNVHQEEGMIDKPIGKSASVANKMIITSKGKPSLSLYKVVERFKYYTLLNVNIKTGRTHQIRVHLEAEGYPLAVDAVYGRKEAFFLSELKLKRYKSGRGKEERPLMSRCTLHAQRLSFTHPVSGERLTFEADLPKDFKAVLQQLRKWGKS